MDCLLQPDPANQAESGPNSLVRADPDQGDAGWPTIDRASVKNDAKNEPGRSLQTMKARARDWSLGGVIWHQGKRAAIESSAVSALLEAANRHENSQLT
ncbi:hypothetical protein C7S18_14870 [Ahniella affigens]|uniref:Uncharacterized protein n=1 Tax=Ahniella affigens TaxID=2021234 RepID=A0A2P1PU86_9GAMM|nr:hypothetical protein C7S18_14870 [Ahniella affigens]